MQHVSVFQDSVVIIPTSSACFNPFKSGLISYKVTKINQILKKKKKKGKKKKKRKKKPNCVQTLFGFTNCVYHVTQQCSSINKDKP